jgi:hypothetical protein
MGIDAVIDAALLALKANQPHAGRRVELGGVRFDMEFATLVLSLGRNAGHSTWAVSALKRGEVLVVPKRGKALELKLQLPDHASRIYCLRDWYQNLIADEIVEKSHQIVFDKGQSIRQDLGAPLLPAVYGLSRFTNQLTYIFLG